MTLTITWWMIPLAITVLSLLCLLIRPKEHGYGAAIDDMISLGVLIILNQAVWMTFILVN